MEPEAFIAEVYRRMSLRYTTAQSAIAWQEMRQRPTVRRAMAQYQSMLPSDKRAPILDIGFGDGWFIAACIELEYQSIFGAEFEGKKAYIKTWSPQVKEILSIKTNIGDLLARSPNEFAFVHLSHVIEHIPKHTLLYNCDALYRALRPGGRILVRTPNMEGPCASSSLFVTLGHEYGFTGSNLKSLLEICNFEDIRFLQLSGVPRTIKQRVGALLRFPIRQWNALKHRLFGVNTGGVFGTELIVSARRGERPPLFDTKFR